MHLSVENLKTSKHFCQSPNLAPSTIFLGHSHTHTKPVVSACHYHKSAFLLCLWINCHWVGEVSVSIPHIKQKQQFSSSVQYNTQAWLVEMWEKTSSCDYAWITELLTSEGQFGPLPPCFLLLKYMHIQQAFDQLHSEFGYGCPSVFGFATCMPVSVLLLFIVFVDYLFLLDFIVCCKQPIVLQMQWKGRIEINLILWLFEQARHRG